ncbi:MAG: hypothetical protein ACK55I_01505, partial [bacterium]
MALAEYLCIAQGKWPVRELPSLGNAHEATCGPCNIRVPQKIKLVKERGGSQGCASPAAHRQQQPGLNTCQTQAVR